MRAALSYWGMAKNRAKYSSEDQKTIGAKIHAAAKEKGIGTEKIDADGGVMKAAVDARAVVLAKAEKIEDLAAATVTDETRAKIAKAAEASVLRKGLVTCAQFCYLIDSMCNLAESVEYESTIEGDDSDVPAKLDACIAMCCDVLL